MLIMLCLKGDANSFFVFVFIVKMFYFNDNVDVDDVFMVIWFKLRPPSRFPLCRACAVVELCVTAWRVQCVGGCATASWPENEKVPIYRVDVRLTLSLNSPLHMLCVLVIFKRIHLLSSVFFLILIVTQMEFKPLSLIWIIKIFNDGTRCKWVVETHNTKALFFLLLCTKQRCTALTSAQLV